MNCVDYIADFHTVYFIIVFIYHLDDTMGIDHEAWNMLILNILLTSFKII